jgi:hypothetical protein
MIDAGIIDQEAQSGGSSCVLLSSNSDTRSLTPLTDEVPKSTCPFTLYAQIDRVAVPEILMQELEEEVQRPTGQWTVKPPKLSVRGVLISRECGLLYEVEDTEGLRCAPFLG